MTSREFLTKVGVLAVALGLTAAPLAFADNQAKKEDANGQSEQATTQHDTANDTSEATGSSDAMGSSDATGSSDAAGSSDATGTSDTTGTSETESNDRTEAGGVGIEGQEGTQAGEEPLPEEESDAQTQ